MLLGPAGRWNRATIAPRRGAAYPYIELGETDHAFDWLERAVDERAGLLIYLKVEPMFDRVRGDARFTRLMRRLQLAY